MHSEYAVGVLREYPCGCVCKRAAASNGQWRATVDCRMLFKLRRVFKFRRVCASALVCFLGFPVAAVASVARLFACFVC